MSVTLASCFSIRTQTAPGRDLELRDVGKPFLIRGGSVEVPVDKVLWRRADFAKVRPVPTPSIGGNDQAFLLHQALHDFLGDV
jgi:hypothetical protein